MITIGVVMRSYRLMGTSRLMSSSASAVKWWDHVAPAPKDPIAGLTEAFLADTSPYKINLGVGAYRDDEGKPVVLQCVREANAKIAGCDFLETIPHAVSTKLVEESIKLVYGNDSDFVEETKVAGVQALSGTGACRLFAEFQKKFCPKSQIYFPDPTWSCHHKIWREAHIPQRTFRYYDLCSKGLNFTAMMDDIKNAPDGSFFLLHPCAHNPTGVDPTEEQWREISHLFKVKNHFPFFDMAYQGLASGDLDRDAQVIRKFVEDGHLVGCAQSFAKNMGLYGQRIGCLSVLCADAKQAAAIKSQMQQIAGAMYGSPPVLGPLLVSAILSDPDIKALWATEVKAMTERIRRMRINLRESLEKLDSPLNWEQITNQVGMFFFSGLTPDQVDCLRREFHIFMNPDGRISMAGVTTGNVNYLANALHEVTRFNQESYVLTSLRSDSG
ncbi:aspartate aminotransferase mitochondrial-like isoform X4 [Tripterygium wilfordii]|uniref:Aspartate aminotransferase n=1 Tax=Tripterygium wilfordii TaxID=458696 RepID=A0A7J7CT46_TRIWF|nr:aspartate aminotransferase, mitochondrial-like isoform X2 [Tripterygium wilfordii]KAF5737277.1 aspartate aminotransferase mitochondrial-like isoform X4 [Tripterygium wilfordii]